MSKNIEHIAEKILSQLTAPHIGLTFYKFKTKAAAVFKDSKADITIDQFIILKLLSEQKNVQQQDLAELLNKSKSNFSRMLNMLEKKSFLERKVDLKGKRTVKLISITPKGKALVEKITHVAEKIHAVALLGISEEELNNLKSTLGKIRDNLEKVIEVKL